MQPEIEAEHKKAYGCLQVKPGDEEKAAQMVKMMFPELEVHVVMQIKHKSRNGVRSYSSDIMIPGYILFQAGCDMQVSRLLMLSSAYHILSYEDFQWQLRGDDLFFAEWIFNHHGTIGVSVALGNGDAIKIIDGPLKEIEGEIIRIDKRNKNALVAIGFKQKTLNLWLAFEWLDKVKKYED